MNSDRIKNWPKEERPRERLLCEGTPKLAGAFPEINRWENGRLMPSKLAKAQLSAFCKKMIKQGKLTLPDDLIDSAGLSQD